VKYGVSLEALQAANPEVRPEALSVGAVLVIPLAADAAIVQVASAPTPMPVLLSTPACYPLATGALYCFLEAYNAGAVALEAVSARVVLAGTDGLPLAEAAAYPALDIVNPGETIPLAARFPAAPAFVAGVGVVPVSALPLSDAASRDLPLEVTETGSSHQGPAWRVAGQVRNASDRAASAGRLVLVLYDEGSAILGYREWELAGGLAGGEVRQFEIEAFALGGQVARYALLGEARP
jgi:hypothetical protein